jgi:FkbH-like protein
MVQSIHDTTLETLIQKAGWERAVQHCLEQEELDRALYYFGKLAELDKTLPVGLVQALVENLFEAGRYEEACQLIEVQTENVAITKENAALLDWLGRIYTKLGQKERAAESWKKLLNALPDYTASALRLADFYAKNDQADEAVGLLLKLVQAAPTPQNYQAAYVRINRFKPKLSAAASNATLRLALIGTSTLDDLLVYLDLNCRLAGLRPETFLGGFNQYSQEILDPNSGLYEFNPELIICKLDARLLFPQVETGLLSMSAEQRRAEVEAIINRIAGLLEILTSRTSATILINNFPLPEYSPFGIADLRDEFGQSAFYSTLNQKLAETVAQRFPTVYVIDEERVAGRIGKRVATDERLWLIARETVSEKLRPELAAEYTRYIKALKGQTKKCLVLDLDNTLWGGIVGEDGPSGLQLGSDAPGNAFNAFQETLLQLSRRGLLLAISSKNNEADALEVLEKHPDMLLRPSHFAAMRINWQDKPANLKEIAKELNIGVDSLVFIDDNPVERALMRQMLPQVLTVEMPSDPALYRRAILELLDLDVLSITQEDLARQKLYQEQAARQRFESQHADNLEAFLYDLQMTVQIDPANELTLPRIAQLINKTNQFNLTTRRYTEAQVREMMADPEKYLILSVRVTDRFGDNGLTGVVIIEKTLQTWKLDTFLLSCRVMSRTVENAVIQYIIELAQKAGMQILQGEYVPTAKNGVVASLYSKLGFDSLEPEAAPDNAATFWQLDITKIIPVVPAWIKLVA